ncbi:sister chromatid cohesion protein PDS5 homolog D isoform X2 [Raphanus sativus]|uniref:Sister chromatid cohesion protein PDS5 homolog D isoform X2 n=1 Tax=Raphanus sativus TaxID=3726 RepID=A0A9W3DC72_RAPSA|nr:sister chromatid cohesion protein PDS5 homolog D isoform X2 [Raphanus sativus]
MAGAKKLSSSAKTKPSSVSGKDKVSNGEDLVGSKVRVWWPIDRKFYNGVVDSFNSRTKKHRVFYDDGEKEILDMDKERWELIGDDDDDNAADEDKSDDEIADVIPEPPNRKSARTNGVMGDIGGKIVAAASRLRSCNKISEATNGKKKRASSSSSEAVSEKVTRPMPSSKKSSKRKRTDDEDVGEDEQASDDESKPLQILVDKLKGKKKKKQEKEAPKEETKEGEPKEETKEGEEPKEEGEEGEEPKEEEEEGEQA